MVCFDGGFWFGLIVLLLHDVISPGVLCVIIICFNCCLLVIACVMLVLNFCLLVAAVGSFNCWLGLLVWFVLV